MPDYTSFIEVQFPVSRVSKESFKERKANLGQTLTGLGKWWGRKPLVMVRAALLGLLMPAGDDPEKDMKVFLKIMTMDDEGLLLRKYKSVPVKDLYFHATDEEKKLFFEKGNAAPRIKKSVGRDEKKTLEDLIFNRLGYDERIKYCRRPEEVELVDEEAWWEINAHLGTKAGSLAELMRELGMRRFGKVPTVGDCFCGGGSVPFEAARMGLDVFASDLNPIAALLTWGALNINGASDEEIEKLREFQKRVYKLADEQISEWGIEHNEKGHRALYYLYCVESRCPECGWKVPLAPSWVIGKGTKTIAVLKQNKNRGFDFEIRSGASEKQMRDAEKNATVKDDKLHCPHCGKATPIYILRGERGEADDASGAGLRQWERDDIVPRPDDVFQERLYCIKWEDDKGERYYASPTKADLQCEEKVVLLLTERFHDWRSKGYLPDMMIEPGEKTDEPIRTRGWRYWHQLFTPRQLLAHGLLMKLIEAEAKIRQERIIGLLAVNKCLNWNAKLSKWGSSEIHEQGLDVFYNQALNTFLNYSARGFKQLESSIFFIINNLKLNVNGEITAQDARQLLILSNFWITDPPYADAVNYHELSEFFLAWDEKLLKKTFPEWYTDSKRALAVTGKGEQFNKSMAAIYRNLAEHMPPDGMQIVMFTHQDVAVWAELALILWSAGLRVMAAWNIATETDAAGLKQGNYVKGTVLLVLRKQSSEDTAFLYELYPEIEEEVKRQIETMRTIDDKDEPNFADPDYLLAAYAASLKVLTSYKRIEDIDVEYELSRSRKRGEETAVEGIIRNAVKIAYDLLKPADIDALSWKTLTPDERFYLKGLDMEKAGADQISAFQELARGFSVVEYKELLAVTRANEARLKTASEFALKTMGQGFGVSLVRNVLAALYTAVKNEDAAAGRAWLHSELPGYWNERRKILEVLSFIASLEYIDSMPVWKDDARYARFLHELVKNDGV